jgi:hypothetical protein
MLHEAMAYHDDHEYLAGIVHFVRSALAADQPGWSRCPARGAGWWAMQGGTDAARVQFADMTRDGRNPRPWTRLRGLSDRFPGDPIRGPAGASH